MPSLKKVLNNTGPYLLNSIKCSINKKKQGWKWESKAVLKIMKKNK